MRVSWLIRSAPIALAATALAAAGLGTVSSGGVAHAAAANPLPAHVFAPYFESYIPGDSPADLSEEAGVKYLTMAFLQTEEEGSCTVYWNGDTETPVSSSVFGDDFDEIRANGGNVIPSFGGYAATHNGTEIADSCTSVDKIAEQFKKVITTYDVPRIDLDIEDNSLDNNAGITRRNKAIAQVESWAESTGRSIEFSYTLPTTTHGLAQSGLHVLRNAASNDARIDVVNLMTFDYYDGAQHDMAEDTKTAAAGLVDQLGNLYPSKSRDQLWSMVGVTEMPGVDDYGPEETFTKEDAGVVLDWAQNKGINTLSFWALQRDNGTCPGGGASNTCSGIEQPKWFFSEAFEPFTSGEQQPPGNTVTVTNPGDQSTDVGEEVSLQIHASDSDSSTTLTYSASGLPEGLSIGSSSGLISGTPTTEETADVTVTATDDTGASGAASFTWTVGGHNPPGNCAAPWSADTTYGPGDEVSYQGDNYTATYYSVGAVPGAPTSWAVWEDDGSCGG